jgi:hypothetical protein
MALCVCGCGLETPIAQVSNQWTKQGEPRRTYPGHRAPRKEWHQEYAKANRAVLSENRRIWRSTTKMEALRRYGGDPPRCACCDERHIEFLNLDHINGDGGAIRRVNPRMSGLYLALWLKKNGWPDGIRVLCWNCNASRGSYGYCPHERAATVSIPTRRPRSSKPDYVHPLEEQPRPCAECRRSYKPLRRGLCARCYDHQYRPDRVRKAPK